MSLALCGFSKVIQVEENGVGVAETIHIRDIDEKIEKLLDNKPARRMNYKSSTPLACRRKKKMVLR